MQCSGLSPIPAGGTASKGNLLAKPNYQYEKRQRDLAKKNKKEEKRRQKLASKATASESENDNPEQPEATGPESGEAAED